MKKKVLMTYMESGMGHITSIKSISDNFKALYGDEFEVIDSYIMQEDHDKRLKKFEDFIIKQTKNTNRIKGFGNFIFFFIKLIGGVKTMRFLHRTLFRKYTNATLEAFKKRDPDIIVSTHYFMTFCALEYKKRFNKNVKVVTYNPDNNVHIWWDNREHLFIVNNENAFYEAIGKRKFNPAMVKQVFYTARDEIVNFNLSKEEVREKLGIDKNKFCVIVADGVYACAKSKKVADQLLKTDKPLTIIMLAGKNDKLFNYYSNLKQSGKIKPNIDLIVLPFMKNIYEYYRAADVFITKAGPNAVLDSVFMDTPVIVDYYAHPIEKATTKLFINNIGAGKAIYKPKKIKEQIEKWIDNRTELDIYADNTKKIDKSQNGGKEAAEFIYKEANRNEVFVTKDEYTNYLYELALQEKFDTYTTPMDFNNSNYDAISYDKIKKENVFSKSYKFIIRNILRFFGPIVNTVGYSVRIKGKKNLKGIKSGITISNHVHYLDCLWNMQALNFKNVYITGAPHNFKKGFFGATLKAGGFIPLTTTLSESKKFQEYISEIIKKGGFVHFYPEQALWLRYEQSRPLKRGAFFYAAKNNVPIIPIVICFRKTNFKKKKNVTINICPPIYPDPSLTERENCEMMNKKAQQVYDETIIEFYKYDKNSYSVSKIAKKVEDKDADLSKTKTEINASQEQEINSNRDNIDAQ